MLSLTIVIFFVCGGPLESAGARACAFVILWDSVLPLRFYRFFFEIYLFVGALFFYSPFLSFSFGVYARWREVGRVGWVGVHEHEHLFFEPVVGLRGTGVRFSSSIPNGGCE